MAEEPEKITVRIEVVVSRNGFAWSKMEAAQRTIELSLPVTTRIDLPHAGYFVESLIEDAMADYMKQVEAAAKDGEDEETEE